MTKFAHPSYQKVLTDLRSTWRGNSWDHDQSLDEMKLLHDIIIDLCPVIDSFESKYKKKFIC